MSRSRIANHALAYDGVNVSYGDLLSWVQILAAQLTSKGCQKGDVIAIFHEKEPLSFALMLAALRLGVAYVNLDLEAPIERNLSILETTGTNFVFFGTTQHRKVITTTAARASCKAIKLSLHNRLNITKAELEKQTQSMLRVDGETIAYIMFTSGSTGVPKGVAVTHQNVLHLISWGRQFFKISDNDRFANLSPLYFDNSVFDFYVCLFSGATLAPVDREILLDPYQTVLYVGKMQCTIWFSVPSLLIYLMAMKAISVELLSALRWIVFGGEGYPKVELKRLYDLFFKHAQLVNVYGPTECTCICSAHIITARDFTCLEGYPPLGNLNPNFDFKIIDTKGQETSRGELCLIGPNVASGYFNDKKRTRQSFSTLTEPNRFMKSMYRTGDIVHESDGVLFFVGRMDNQIKHMGYRIELEEIENALVKIPGISQAGAVYKRKGSTHGKIYGFVATQRLIDEEILINEIARLLPRYMLPHRIFVKLELPKNRNGKVDRTALEEDI